MGNFRHSLLIWVFFFFACKFFFFSYVLMNRNCAIGLEDMVSNHIVAPFLQPYLPLYGAGTMHYLQMLTGQSEFLHLYLTSSFKTQQSTFLYQ